MSTPGVKRPVGWYPDPYGAASPVYWDGSTWIGVVDARRLGVPPPSEGSATVAGSDDESRRHRYIGDAHVGVWTVRQLFDALCWILAGIMLIVIGAAPDISSGWLIALGICVALYGVWILVGARSYWVSSWVYALALIAVVGAWAAVF